MGFKADTKKEIFLLECLMNTTREGTKVELVKLKVRYDDTIARHAELLRKFTDLEGKVDVLDRALRKVEANAHP